MKYQVIDHGPWLEAMGAHSGYRVRMSTASSGAAGQWAVQVFVRGSESEGEVAVDVPHRPLASAAEAFDFGYQCATLWIDAQSHRMARELRCHHPK
jgi:hypothetical protein